MHIAIMSDSHDRWDHLEKAIQIANKHGCELLLHAGDLIAPPGIAVLEKFNGKVKFVWGNNEAERVGTTRMYKSWTQVELASKLNSDQSVIARIENARTRPSMKILQKLANALETEFKISIKPEEKPKSIDLSDIDDLNN